MIELIFITCLSASPADCQERSLLYTDISAMACVMAAQPELAKWAQSNPRWRIMRWRCAPVSHLEQDA
ncbi:hypothetical protein PEL8287_02250 [Roseovarius litorisediminis]|uniref:Uncharacterized protein n=1 Tax=Roseovarius litorisediminis TaxID=1312363 RepID=A0A1Y5SNS4_9RHOB|nr:hypothetical protein [Roseovarius litorisediminis]SLN44359.1 hypothetical protein PEL8287_02250 [Roseovarius litorisediminis]